ncbi:MAG: hypothetical protein RLZZ206_3601 [Cyanobacteriota bacterium]|jgi:hypothetical protein
MVRNGIRFQTGLSHPAHGRRHPAAAPLDWDGGDRLLTAKIQP